MPINAHPEYIAAEKEYLAAHTLEEKIERLKKMISVAPKHKGSENLLAQLRARLKKFLEQQEKSKKSGRGGKPGIKKEEMQAVIVGFTNSGKSTLLSSLTNAAPEITSYYFTTKTPVVGIMKYAGTNIQLIEIPAVESDYYDSGLVNTADAILIVITNLDDLEKILPRLNRAKGKKLIIFNIKDEAQDTRKIEATLKSKKHDFVIISTKIKRGFEELKEKIFQGFGKIRVYTKEPGKDKSTSPLIMKQDSTVKDVADKIFHDFSKVKETKIWGPSSKFPGQKVGLQHRLKDMDIVEFKTR